MPYAVGLLTAERGSDLLSKDSWTKSPVPVFKTCAENGQYGPGHNSFTKSEDDSEDLMIYHCRNYTEIKGDPLFDRIVMPGRRGQVDGVRPRLRCAGTRQSVDSGHDGCVAGRRRRSCGNAGSELTCVIVRNVAIPTKTNN